MTERNTDLKREMAHRLEDELLRLPPASRLIQVPGSRSDLRVWMREIRQHDTPATFGVQPNPPLYVYETAAAFLNPDRRPDPARGLEPIRQTWIDERDDTEWLQQPGSEHTRARRQAAAEPAFPNPPRPRRARAGRTVTQLHYARRGVVTPEMEYVAIRENARLDEMRDAWEAAGLLRRQPGQPFGARLPEQVTPEFVRNEIAAGRAGQGQRQYRQFGGTLFDSR